jgi:streptogramin lyase
MRQVLVVGPSAPLASAVPAGAAIETQELRPPAGAYPHDLAPAPDGAVYFASLAGSSIARLDLDLLARLRRV